MSRPDELELASFLTTKTVRAAPIISIEVEDGRQVARILDGHGRPAKVILPHGFTARGFPKPGDMLVVYDDDYMSWSPRETFNRHATRTPISADVVHFPRLRG